MLLSKKCDIFHEVAGCRCRFLQMGLDWLLLGENRVLHEAEGCMPLAAEDGLLFVHLRHIINSAVCGTPCGICKCDGSGVVHCNCFFLSCHSGKIEQLSQGIDGKEEWQFLNCIAVLWQDAGRLQQCKQVVVNLSEDCLWNLLSSVSNTGELWKTAGCAVFAMAACISLVLLL